MYAATRRPNFECGAGHHCPPAGDGPASGAPINEDIYLDTNIVSCCYMSVEKNTFDPLSPDRLWGCEHFQWQAVRVSVDPGKKHTLRQ